MSGIHNHWCYELWFEAGCEYEKFLEAKPEGEEDTWQKFVNIIKEYREYKANYVRHIKFDPKSSEHYPSM